jgi:hypothetical protein
MSVELWIPSECDARSGQEAYIHYIGGLMLLHDPDSEISQAHIGLAAQDETFREVVITTAEELMYQGLKGIILHASPPERRPVSLAESAHEETLPTIWNIVDEACTRQESRLNVISPAIAVGRPMPLIDLAIYKAICHGRRKNLQTRKLMGMFMPDPWLAPALKGRHLPERAAG